MGKKCAKCGHDLKENDFLCPECGFIWGEAYDKSVRSPSAKAEKAEFLPQKKWILLFAFLLLTAVALCWIQWRLIPVISGSVSDATQSTRMEPYVVYSVQVVAPVGEGVPGVAVCFTDSVTGHTVTVQTDEEGLAWLEHRRSERMVVTLQDLPDGVSTLQSQYSFGTDTQLRIAVTYLGGFIPEFTTYSVTVLDENLRPVAGVGVRIHSLFSSVMPPTGYTDEHGRYEIGGTSTVRMSAEIVSVPDGYDGSLIGEYYAFESYGSTNIFLMIRQADDVLWDEQETYTVKVVDQYGVPVTDVIIGFSNQSTYLITTSNTDRNGECSIELPAGQYCNVFIMSIPQGYVRPDPSLQTYVFAEGSKEMQIILYRVIVNGQG